MDGVLKLNTKRTVRLPLSLCAIARSTGPILPFNNFIFYGTCRANGRRLLKENEHDRTASVCNSTFRIRLHR
jgi:hypothetical protein